MTAAPPISQPVLWFFRRIVRGYFRRHFDAVRLSRTSSTTALTAPRLILYANHSSWWDPMVSVLLAAELMPARRHFAPMDSDALARYGILRRIGIFPVEMRTARGAVQFLRTGRAVVEGGDALWITPQGRFADPRERPLAFKPGLAALSARVEGGCTVLPLAIEYVFWDERLPETLLHFGEPITVNGQTSEELEQQLDAALVKTMDQLKALAITRDPRAFRTLEQGHAGTGGFYEFGQRTLARLRGRTFQPGHARAAYDAPRTTPHVPREERG